MNTKMHSPVIFHPDFQISNRPYTVHGVIKTESGVLTVIPSKGTEASYLEQKRKDLMVLTNRGKERRIRVVELPLCSNSGSELGPNVQALLPEFSSLLVLLMTLLIYLFKRFATSQAFTTIPQTELGAMADRTEQSKSILKVTSDATESVLEVKNDIFQDAIQGIEATPLLSPVYHRSKEFIYSSSNINLCLYYCTIICLSPFQLTRIKKRY